MIYKLSNLLLLIALICVCLAWWVDRRSQESKQDRKILGAIAETEFESVMKMADRHRNDGDDFPIGVEEELVQLVVRLFHDKKNIESFHENHPYRIVHMSPEQSAHYVLKYLGLTKDQFFQQLRKHWPFEWVRIYSEPGGEEYEEFSAFVEYCMGNGP